MRIVFNTYYPNAAASAFYLSGLSKIKHDFTVNDYSNYDKFDIGLFMTYPKDLEALKEAKKKSPNLKTGLIDPRNSSVEKYIEYIDFFIVDSIEMYDFFCRFKKPIFTYYEYPDIKNQKKTHKQKEKIIIAYHGNKIHLAGMYNTAGFAISELAKKYNLEFWAIYNIKELQKLDFGLPSNVKIKHIQWTENVYNEILSNADIGIAPALIPVFRPKRIKRKAAVFRKFFLETKDDYLTRYKMPTNPGRIIVFAKLGIPVVADFYPSALQFIRHEENGLLAYSAGAWYAALEKLIKDHKLRQNLSDKMVENLYEYDYEVQNIRLLEFLKEILLSSESVSYKPIPLDKNNSWYLLQKSFFSYLKTKFYYLKRYLLKNK